MYFILALRTPGLVLEDLDPRLYLNEAPATLPGEAALSDIAGGNYLASGWPEGSRSRCYTLTYSYGGVWYSKIWGGWIDFGGAPERVILPVRTAGLDVDSLAPVLYRAGEPEEVDFASAEVGSPGDYLISGWEVRSEGAPCLLTWEPGGELAWREEEAPAATPVALAYDTQRKKTAATLARKGGPVTLRRPVLTYDESTQTSEADDPEDFGLHAVVTSYDQKLVDGENILPTDRKGIVSVTDALQEAISEGAKPDTTWRLIADDVDYGVQNVAPLQPAPGGAWIFMEIQMRAGG